MSIGNTINQIDTTIEISSIDKMSNELKDIDEQITHIDRVKTLVLPEKIARMEKLGTARTIVMDDLMKKRNDLVEKSKRLYSYLCKVKHGQNEASAMRASEISDSVGI